LPILSFASLLGRVGDVRRDRHEWLEISAGKAPPFTGGMIMADGRMIETI